MGIRASRVDAWVKAGRYGQAGKSDGRKVAEKKIRRKPGDEWTQVERERDKDRRDRQML